MSIQAGAYRLGPDDGTLSLRTGRGGAVARAGHDLLIHVTSWEATLEVGQDPADTSLEVTADGGSLRVREGTGGMQKLDDGDKADIEQTIDDEILKRQAITFRSSEAQPTHDGGLRVRGELTLLGTARPIELDLNAGDGRLRGAAVIRQTDWGIKPYSALFGALKVADEVTIEIDAALPAG